MFRKLDAMLANLQNIGFGGCLTSCKTTNDEDKDCQQSCANGSKGLSANTLEKVRAKETDDQTPSIQDDVLSKSVPETFKPRNGIQSEAALCCQ